MSNCRRLVSAALAVLISTPVAAQLTSVPHSGEQSIVVTGERPKGAKPTARFEISDWRVAETAHILLFSKGDPKEIARIANNLEKLHFLLSVLLDRTDAPDQTLKISVTMIGDAADFDHLALHNDRWQQGPYPNEFPNEIYYDPREDGAVLATAHVDQCFKLDRSAAIITGEELMGYGSAAIDPSGRFPESPSRRTATPCGGNPNKVSVTAEGRLYATYAQHYLLTYFPAAYPRWYVEGFGEIFSNMDANTPGLIEYGRWPDKYRQVLDKFGHYPLQRILDGTYLHDKRWTPAFSPYTAWALAHFLFFSNEWRTPLHNYLAAVASGQSSERAGAALGNVNKLAKQIASYQGTKVPFERLTYPAGRFPPAAIRQLKTSEAIYVQGRLELGARVTMPDATGTDPATADSGLAAARQKALSRRERWLNSLRANAATYPTELANQQLLAEGECRSGYADECVATADHALSIAGNDVVALTWKGYGLSLQAAKDSGGERSSKLAEARSVISRANHLDNESVLPLLAYYRSFVIAGEAVPDLAVDGLAKSLDEVPSAPATRLLLGDALVARSDTIDAARILLPVARGAFDSPEKAKAQQLLTPIVIDDKPAGNNSPTH